ncbi:hypothetical protein A9306_06020 [Moraxella atlantae]|uniref:Uncharacterized protein n=1 Tax=Faucicola atlantae TaxID=34059 RepID=A0A1B8QHC8_9GAMM|nr:hypothetical protein A9306_06020 [Moraxella atlantae]
MGESKAEFFGVCGGGVVSRSANLRKLCYNSASYIIPSFQVRQAFPLATPHKTAKAILLKRQKKK